MHALLTERPRPERIRRLPAAWRLAVVTVCFGAFMGQLDASIVTLTFRPMKRAFSAPLAAVDAPADDVQPDAGKWRMKRPPKNA